MKTCKKLLSVLLSLLIALLSLSALGAGFTASAVAISGTCGDNITWQYEDGVLVISGQGVIKPQTVNFRIDTAGWNPMTGEFETVYTTEERTTFPWYSKLENTLALATGFPNLSALETAWNYGAVDTKAYYRNMFRMVTDIIIEEGVSAIPAGAFSTTFTIPFLPRSISLPSTILSLDQDAFNSSFAEKIAIANPSLNIGHSFQLLSFVNTPPADYSLEKFVSSMIDEVAELHKFTSAKNLATIVLALQAEKESLAGATEQQVQQTQTERVEMASKYFVTRSATYDGVIRELFARLKTIVGISASDKDFENISDIGSITPPSNGGEGNTIAAQVNYTDAFRAKMDALQAASSAAASAVTESRPEMSIFYLGDKASGTPAPWIKVYGKEDSSAKTAATASGVQFVSLDGFKPANSKEEEQTPGGLSGLLQRLINFIKSFVDRIRGLFKSASSLPFESMFEEL